MDGILLYLSYQVWFGGPISALVYMIVFYWTNRNTDWRVE